MAEPILPEMQDITRQRELAKMLLQKGMTDNLQGQMVSGRYVGASPLQGIANMYSAYQGKQLAEESDKKQAELSKMLRQQTMQDIQSYGEALKGTPEQTVYGAGMEGPTMDVTPAVAPNPEKGLGILMGSRSPQSQALGQALLADQLKTQVLPEGGTLIRGGIGGTGQTVEGKPKQTELMRDYNFAQTPQGGGFKGSFTDYDLMRRNASSQKINVQNALPFQEQIYTDTGKALIGDFNTLKSIPSQVKQLDRVAELAPKSFAGSAANAKLEGAKFLNNNLGLNIAPNKIVATEELRTVLFTNIMDNLKKMDASPSQEQQRVMQASLGNIGTDPAALPAVVNVYRQILVDKANEHNRRVGQTIEKGFKYPYDITVNVPTPEQAAPAGNKLTPNVGDVQGGWRFKGGNPAVPTSWERAK
jgi:hypothetical protein